RAGGEDHAENAQAHRQLVGDELRAGTQAAEKAVFAVAGPAAEDHAVDGDARQSEDINNAYIDVRRDDQLDRLVTPQRADMNRWNETAEGNHSVDRERRGDNRERRENEEPAIDMRGRVFFLEDEFQPVGQRL